jgi:hypothetical protein
MTLQSSLAPFVAAPAADAGRLDAMRRAAWHLQGVVVLCPDEIDAQHPFLAEIVRSWATMRYGARKDGK